MREIRIPVVRSPAYVASLALARSEFPSRTPLLARWLAFLLLAICVALPACATQRPPTVVALPNGYYLQRDKAKQPALVRRGGSVVLKGPIAAYAVHGDLVVGCVSDWKPEGAAYPSQIAFPGSPDARYFVFETRTGRLEKDLDEAAWKAELKERGVPESIRIVAPFLPD
ncbi:MAG: hypothetical protein DIU56_010585 [Pseudomonadota bacterium]|jgi:hypothetical protein